MTGLCRELLMSNNFIKTCSDGEKEGRIRDYFKVQRPHEMHM